MREHWKEYARKTGTSLSKFIIEHVENSIQKEKSEDQYHTRLDLLKQLKQLKEENQKLKKQNKMMDTVIERLESALKEKNVEPFIETDNKKYRKYGVELIELFREKGEIRKEELLEHLNIDISDFKLVSGIHKQIDELERYGIIKDRGAMWEWTP
jgi:predicted RNase H-like nuclease (RuvC/YqgF family)